MKCDVLVRALAGALLFGMLVACPPGSVVKDGSPVDAASGDPGHRDVGNHDLLGPDVVTHDVVTHDVVTHDVVTHDVVTHDVVMDRNELDAGNPLPPDVPATYPWLVFQDWSHQLDVGGYTPEQQQKIAALGLGIWPITRVMTDTGMAQIEAIKAINPDFVVTCIYSTLTFSAGEPWAGRWLDHRMWELLSPHPALHQDGTWIRSWPPDLTTDATAMWHTTLPASDGYSYNRAVMEELLAAMEQAMTQYGGPCEGMWQDYYTVGGPYLFPVESELHGAADLDQDGVAFADDTDEQQAWLDWERDFSRELELRFGPGFIQFPNGNAVYAGRPGADQELAQQVNGAIFEGFPNLPWYNPAEAVHQLHQMYIAGWSQPTRGHLWNMLFLRPQSSASQVQAARIASMVFLTPYFRASRVDDIWFEDDHGIAVGASIGELSVVTQGDSVTYSRPFELGLARIVAHFDTGLIDVSLSPN